MYVEVSHSPALVAEFHYGDFYRQHGVDPGTFDPTIDFVASIPSLQERTGVALIEESDSYRAHVAAGLTAVHTGLEIAGQFIAANTKLFSPIRKRCAEQKIWQEARDSGYVLLGGLLIRADMDEEMIRSITPEVPVDYPLPTLPTCSDCIQTATCYQAEGKLRMPNSLPVVTYNGRTHALQVFSMGELIHLQGRGSRPTHTPPPVHGVDAREVNIGEVVDILKFKQARIKNILERRAKRAYLLRDSLLEVA